MFYVLMNNLLLTFELLHDSSTQTSQLGPVAPTTIKSRFNWTAFTGERRFEPSKSHFVAPTWTWFNWPSISWSAIWTVVIMWTTLIGYKQWRHMQSP